MKKEKNIVAQENDSIKTDKNGIIKLANILFVFSIIGLILSGLVVFSFLTLILYYLILIIIIFLTLFTLFSKLQPWFEGGEKVQQFIGVAYQVLPYIIAFGMATGIASLIIYITQKNYIHRKSKIITTSIFLVLYVIAIILRFVIFANN